MGCLDSANEWRSIEHRRQKESEPTGNGNLTEIEPEMLIGAIQGILKGEVSQYH
jgi:hypothetical protein